jgi:hypothetical protein
LLLWHRGVWPLWRTRNGLNVKYTSVEFFAHRVGWLLWIQSLQTEKFQHWNVMRIADCGKAFQGSGCQDT